ncbi:Interleukin-2 receptor subunit beta like [Melia azedarach]|uniref:Interleukin-2 receptor subunit beta like n=1 Tax=Melia azedarach TaxID=155640 RepID=A0ACC1X9L5_MELAZ|nr:Interleukin-2 receptor subunit beta like [Melia azedarach]
MYNECASPSLKTRIKSSMCCFGTSSHSKLEDFDYEYDDVKQPRTPRSPRSPYGWLKSSLSQELEMKDKRRSIFSKIGAKNRRRPNSGDFRYDPLSYSLNFEDDMTRDDEYRVNFSARLPASPDRSQEAPIVTREILACS